jgi:hypothetical protein
MSSLLGSFFSLDFPDDYPQNSGFSFDLFDYVIPGKHPSSALFWLLAGQSPVTNFVMRL